ncbi:LytTR family DNA-binding domain-containing protein, partial [Muribaculum intestinale]|uniref:LytTR family DNA-binding domain-containing protein n=1 Tax=Muribaculum intestinale TaxID=1796646 RepID=UPI0025A9A144
RGQINLGRRGHPRLGFPITMKEMESLFPTDRFIRVHRSFIVSLDSIDKFSNRRIFLKNYDKYIPVGRTYNDSFNNLYTIFKQNDK